MNYYPNNFYSNYSYNSNLAAVPANGLQGKVVDSEDVVRATEVPFGGYGVFPKADLSEIFIKNWNSNGTTQIISYRPVVRQEEKTNVSIHDELLQKMNNIEEKLDIMLSPKKPIIVEKKKGVE